MASRKSVSAQQAKPVAQLSTQYLQDQVAFLTEQLKKMQQDLEEKELTIQRIMMEKRTYARKFDELEAQNNQLLETLSSVENEKDEAEKTNQSLQLIVTAQNYTRKTISPRRASAAGSKHGQDKLILEEDGIKCFDLDAV